jgi:hypothetical protein
LFDQNGKRLSGVLAAACSWPHGLDVDKEGTSGDRFGRGEPDPERRQRVRHHGLKFSPEGKVLMTLGTPGEAGVVPAHFNSPSDIAIASNGDVFIADGHADNGNNRVVKFSKDGK